MKNCFISPTPRLPRRAAGLALVAALLVTPLLRGASPTSDAFNVRNYGAKGDGHTLDTAAINQAIDAAAAAGGGTVYFPAGTYASYSIHLKSNVALYIDQGATILGADSRTDGQPSYDPPEANDFPQYQDFGHTHWHNSLIWGENIQNVSILGPGTIFGKGLSRGSARIDPLPGVEAPPAPKPTDEEKKKITPGPFGYPSAGDVLPAGFGNKAIALKNCRNVTLRDFTIFHGGHFGILATGVDNFTLDNLKIDTNRDGMDIDCCWNTRVSNCTVNSPHDDGICPKSSFGLGYNRATENLTITNCYVSGFEEGSVLDGTRKRTLKHGAPNGRIKLGTEGNGGFKNITISNCVFEYCRGLALEEVDGGPMEDISVSNITMRDIENAPIYIRLGGRLRGPNNPPVGTACRINIIDIVAYNVAPEHGILVVGIPGSYAEDIRLSNILIVYQGGGTQEQAAREVPETEKEIKAYPEPRNMGIMPSYGMFARHVKNLSVDHVEFRYAKEDLRPAIFLGDVIGADFDHLKVQHETGVSTFVLQNVQGFSVHNSAGLPETKRDEKIASDKL